MLHHLMIGTWTPPGAIFTVEFDDESLSLKLIKKTTIPHDEPISWMTFDVSRLLLSSAQCFSLTSMSLYPAHEKEHLWSVDEKVL